MFKKLGVEKKDGTLQKKDRCLIPEIGVIERVLIIYSHLE